MPACRARRRRRHDRAASRARRPRSAPKSAWYARSASRRCDAQQLAVLAAERLPQPAPVLELDHLPAEVRNCASSSAARMPGMTRSSDCRLRSTIQRTFPSLRASGSASASQMFPSSSSASPSSEMKRPPVDEPKWLSTYRSASDAEQRRRRARARPSRWSSRPGTGPSCATGSSAGRRSRATASDRSDRAGPAGTRSRAARARRAASPTPGRALAGRRGTAPSSASPSTPTTPDDHPPSARRPSAARGWRSRRSAPRARAHAARSPTAPPGRGRVALTRRSSFRRCYENAAAYPFSAGWPPRWAYSTREPGAMRPSRTRSIRAAIDLPS